MLSLGFGAWIVPTLVRVWGLTIPQIGFALGLMMLVGPPIGLGVVGFLMDRFTAKYGLHGPLYVGMGAIILITIVACLAPIWPTLTGTWLLLGCLMLLGGACFPVANTLFAALAPLELLGRITGVQYMIYGLMAGGASATLIAVVSDRLFDGPAAIAHALSVMCLIYGVVSFAMATLAVHNLRRSDWGSRSSAPT